MLRDWLLHLSVTGGLGFFLGLVFNSGNPLLSGFQAALAAAAGTAIVTKAKKSYFQKNSAALRSQISRLQAKSHALQHNILTATDEQAQVTTELDSYYQRRQAAEQHISALEAARQRMTAESQQVQGQLTSLQTERTSLEESIAKITIDRQQLLAGKQELTAQTSNSKQQLESEEQELSATITQLKIAQEQSWSDAQQESEKLTTLQAEQQILKESITKIGIDRQQLLADNLEIQSQLSSSQQQQELEKQELSTLVAQLATEQMKYISESQQLTTEITQLANQKHILQSDLEQLQQQIAQAQQLNTEFTIIQNTDAWDEPPVEIAIAAENWPARFEDLTVQAVFIHLQEYGSVTEAELTQMLEGNPRKARQFALKFEEYLQLVPFKARVEVSASGKRYVRE
jgi:chromosome segregation ATPase